MTDVRSSLLEEGDPAQDSRAFRRTLGQFATGVTVITTRTDETLIGLTANSFSSVSLDPPLVLWSIIRNSNSAPLFAAARYFAVNVLEASQTALSHAFSRSDANKFDGVKWSAGRYGAPLLDGAIATLECETETCHDGGDHIIIVGRVCRFARYSGDVLVFVQGRYGVAREHPGANTEGSPARRPAADDDGPSLLRLLFAAQYRCSEAFERHRKAEGLTLLQTRILLDLPENGNISAQEIAASAYLSDQATEDGANELIVLGYARRDACGRYGVTESGRLRQEAIRARRTVFEAQQWAELTPAEISSVKRFLRSIVDRAHPADIAH